MFNDQRSKKIVLVAHCLLNQNAKIDACAYYPGAIKEAVELLLAADVGIVQLPCPELYCLGLDREVSPGTNPSVEAEDSRVAKRMAEEKAQAWCRKTVNSVIFELNEYQKHGFQIVGLIGINCSPTCGVDTTWSEDHEHAGHGVFIRMLKDELDQQGIVVRMAGIKARDAAEAICAVKNILG